jgi:excisionase family DNA binding protein
MIPDKLFFRADELANILDVHVRTIRRWVQEGKLNVVRLPSNQMRIQRKDILIALTSTIEEQ